MAHNANAGVAPAQAVASQTYRDYFAQPEHDPFSGDYTEVLAPYRIPLANQNVPTPAAVQTLSLDCSSQNVPTAFLLQHDDGMLHIYLQLAKFHTRMGLPATIWDDQMYIQKGELYHNQSQMVTWSPAYFRQVTAAIRVSTREAIATAYAGDQDAVYLGPFADGEAGTELIRIRRTCYVPPAYVAMFLDGPLNPRTAWETVVQHIYAEGRQAACAALIDYIRGSLTRSTANALPLLCVAPPHAPLADRVLLEHRRRILERDFPILNQALPRLQQNAIATQLGRLVADNRISREEADLRRLQAEEKPLADLIGDQGVAQLLRMANVRSEAELPDIWGTLTRTKKAGRLNVLQHAIDIAKQACDEPEMQFIATPALLLMFTTINFQMSSMDSIVSGLQPFLFGEQLEEDARRSMYTYEALYSGGAAPTATDVEAITRAKVSPPLQHFQARHMIRRTAIALQLGLGANHALVTMLNAFCVRYTSLESKLWGLEMSQPKELLPTMICRYVGLRLNMWFTKIRTVPNAVPPSILDFFDNIMMDENWEKPVPMAVLSQLGLQRFHPSQRGGGSRAPIAPTGAGQGGTGGNAGAGGANAGGGSGGGGGGGTRSVRVNNTEFNSMFQPYHDMRTVTCRMLKTRIANGEIPPLPVSKVNPSVKMCLPWHTRAQCMTNCNSAADHVAYTSEEYAPLLSWCTEHFREA